MSRRTVEVEDVDHVAARRRQWAVELPDVDTRGMAVLGRARWVTLRVRGPIEQAFSDHGINAGEFDVLATLLRSGAPYKMRPTELFTSLMVSSGGLTDRLTRLERSGLIARPEPDGDARSLPVQLTSEGRIRAEAAFRRDMEVEAQLLGVLDEGETETLGALLAKLALGIDAHINSLEAAAADLRQRR